MVDHEDHEDLHDEDPHDEDPRDKDPHDNDEPPVDWRSRVSSVGLVVGSAMIGLEKVLFPEKRKADSEQVTNEPLDKWPHLDFGSGGLEQLGPDEDGYWPS